MTSPIVRQHSDSRAYTTIKNAPTVLPRSISRLAQTSEDKTLPIGYHSTVDRFRPAKTSLPPTLSVRRRESRKSKDGVRVPLVLSPSIGLEKEISLANSFVPLSGVFSKLTTDQILIYRSTCALYLLFHHSAIRPQSLACCRPNSTLVSYDPNDLLLLS